MMKLCWHCSCSRWTIVLWLLLASSGLLHAQEAPSLTTPPFTNTSHRQSVCDRQDLLPTRDVKLRDALVGLELRPLFAESAYSRLAEGDNSTMVIDAERPGLLVELMDELAVRARFTWRNSFGLLTQAVIQDSLTQNRTYDELLLWTVDTYDISVAEWSKSVPRMALGASFLEGWYDSSIIMVGIPGDYDEKLDVWAFLYPFDAGVWTMIGVTILLSGLVYWGMEMFDQASDLQGLESKPQTSIFLAALLFSSHFEFKPRTNGAMLFTLSLAFWCLLIVAVYTANLASFLVARSQPTLIIQTVGDAVIAGLPFCSLETSYPEQSVQAAYPEVQLVRKSDIEDIYLGVQNGECRFALTTVSSWDEAQRDKTKNRDCRMEWIGRAFEFVEGSFATLSDSGTLCTSLIRDVLNVHLLEMKKDGFLDRAWKRHLEALTTVDCQGGIASVDEGDARLSLSDTGGLFIIHYAGTFLAIIIAVIQKWHCGKRHKAEKAQRSSSEDARSNGVNGDNGAELSGPKEPQDLYERHSKNLEDVLGIVHSLQDELAEMRNLAAEFESEKGF